MRSELELSHDTSQSLKVVLKAPDIHCGNVRGDKSRILFFNFFKD